ncbi:MAG: hypothetical protein RBR86_09175 [Pseudobdellovibrionaceae bacterium]|jgi:hypothetical protein|nr:hypothetical protein [Pseudobdellovibrionaceae bacterium]
MAARFRINLAMKFLIVAGISLGTTAAQPTNLQKRTDLESADVIISAKGHINIIKAFDVAFEKTHDEQIKFSTIPEDLNLRPVYVECSEVRTYNAFPWLVSDARLKGRILESYGEDFEKLFGNLNVVDQEKNDKANRSADVEKEVWKIIIARTRAALVNADNICSRSLKPGF